METIDRIRVYRAQNGFTPAQQRRIKKKIRKGMETGGKVHRKPRRGERSAFLQDAKPAPSVPAETYGDFGPVPEPAVIDDAVFEAAFEASCEPLAGWEIELLNDPSAEVEAFVKSVAHSIGDADPGTNYCPRCKVEGDQPCVTPSGKATKTHKGRGE